MKRKLSTTEEEFEYKEVSFKQPMLEIFMDETLFHGPRFSFSWWTSEFKEFKSNLLTSPDHGLALDKIYMKYRLDNLEGFPGKRIEDQENGINGSFLTHHFTTYMVDDTNSYTEYPLLSNYWGGKRLLYRDPYAEPERGLGRFSQSLKYVWQEKTLAPDPNDDFLFKNVDSRLVTEKKPEFVDWNFEFYSFQNWNYQRATGLLNIYKKNVNRFTLRMNVLFIRLEKNNDVLGRIALIFKQLTCPKMHVEWSTDFNLFKRVEHKRQRIE